MNILLHTLKFLFYCQKEIVAMVFIYFIVILYLFCNIFILSHDEQTYLPICLLERFAIFLSAKMNLRETLHQRTKIF